MKIQAILFCCILSISIIQADFYNALVMRDIAILIDSTETIQREFSKNNFFLTASVPSPISDDLAQLLLQNSIPIITTQSLLKNIFELSELFEDLTMNPDIDKFIDKYKTNKIFEQTILLDHDNLLKLSQVCSHVKNKTYNLAERVEQFNQQFYKTSVSPHILNSSIELFLKRQLASFKLPVATEIVLLNKALQLYKHSLIIKKIQSYKYEIYALDNFLVLIIPTNYLEKAKTAMSIFSRFNKVNYQLNSQFDFDEAILGLSYKKLSPILNPFSSSSYHLNPGLDDHLKQSFIDILNKLFISKKYKIFKNIFNIQKIHKILKYYSWNIYINGHGSSSTAIEPQTSGVPDETFKKMLYFFNSKINTNFIFYCSCYGAGSKLMLFNIPNQNYILTAGAIAEITTSAITPPNFKVNIYTKQLEPYFYTNPAEALSTLRETPINYFNLLNDIQRFWIQHKNQNLVFYEKNIPQIKFPNGNWFDIANLNNNELILNKRLIQLHEHNKTPIKVINKALLFLYSKYIYEEQQHANAITINVPIIITGQVPTVITMDLNAPKYFFKYVDGKDFSLPEIALKFMGLPKKNNVSIYIESLDTKNSLIKPITNYEISYQNILKKVDPLLKDPVITLKNVEIINLPYSANIQFDYQNKSYRIQAQSFDELKQILTSSGEKNLLPGFSSFKHPQAQSSAFQNIETALQKRLEQRKQAALRQQIFNLQILSRTLNQLSII